MNTQERPVRFQVWFSGGPGTHPERSREYVDELIHDAAWEAIKQSDLPNLLPTNEAVDAKAVELQQKIRGLVDCFLIVNEVAAME